MNPENTNNRIFAAALTITTSLGGPEALVKPCSNIIYPDQDNNNTLNIGAPTNIIEEAGFQLGPEQGAGPEQQQEENLPVSLRINTWELRPESTLQGINGALNQLTPDQLSELANNEFYRGVIADQLLHRHELITNYSLAPEVEINTNMFIYVEEGSAQAGGYLTVHSDEGDFISFQDVNPQTPLQVYKLRETDQFQITRLETGEFAPVYTNLNNPDSSVILTSSADRITEFTREHVLLDSISFPQTINGGGRNPNLRSGPGTDFERVGNLTHDLPVLGKTRNADNEIWYAVEYDNDLINGFNPVYGRIDVVSETAIPTPEITTPKPVSITSILARRDHPDSYYNSAINSEIPAKILNEYPPEIINGGYEWSGHYNTFTHTREDGVLAVFRNHMSEDPERCWLTIADEMYFPDLDINITLEWDLESMQERPNWHGYTGLVFNDEFPDRFRTWVAEDLESFAEIIKGKNIHITLVSEFEDDENQAKVFVRSPGVGVAYALESDSVNNSVTIRAYTASFSPVYNPDRAADDLTFSRIVYYSLLLASSGNYGNNPSATFSGMGGPYGGASRGVRTMFPTGLGDPPNVEEASKLVQLTS